MGDMDDGEVRTLREVHDDGDCGKSLHGCRVEGCANYHRSPAEWERLALHLQTEVVRLTEMWRTAKDERDRYRAMLCEAGIDTELPSCDVPGCPRACDEENDELRAENERLTRLVTCPMCKHGPECMETPYICEGCWHERQAKHEAEVARLTRERDEAREAYRKMTRCLCECGGFKGREFEALRRAETAEARVAELEAALREARDIITLGAAETANEATLRVVVGEIKRTIDGAVTP